MNITKRALILHPWLKGRGDAGSRSPEACLEEAVRLAHAIDLEVVDSAIVAMSNIRPSTLIGSGKVEEIQERVAAAEAGLVIVNHIVSPVQQRNLEKAWNCKVIDRTALILEIFGARARTHEGKLQVELAALEYQKSRLVRSWTHLERQRGGFGFLGGPGESQIEIDRRLIRDRISKIKKQLENVTRTRDLHRKVRRDTPYPVVALVGYTNAGKSTLFNRLTGAAVLSMDKLFATLDPTMRSCVLPEGTKIILSDTVGFVSDLPTQLVAAFRATLEEVLEADVLLHVRDISHPDSEAQKQDVEHVLKSLFSSDALPENLVEVQNKIDLQNHPLTLWEGEGGGVSVSENFQSETLPPTLTLPHKRGGNIRVSAHTGEGVDTLLGTIEAMLAKRFYNKVTYKIAHSDGKALAWLHAHGKVVEQTVLDEYIHLVVQLAPDNIARFNRLYHAENI